MNLIDVTPGLTISGMKDEEEGSGALNHIITPSRPEARQDQCVMLECLMGNHNYPVLNAPGENPGGIMCHLRCICATI